MKYADINKRYTEVVAEYMAKGYTVNTASMVGHQINEVAKIDLTDGKEIIRILLNSFTDWKSDTRGFEIVVGKNVVDMVRPNVSDTWGTIWNNKLEVISTERFYSMSRDNADYFSTEEEALRAAKIREERAWRKWSGESKRSENNLSPKTMELAKAVIRRRLCYRRINEANVELFKKDGSYWVRYNGSKQYRLR